MKGLMKGKRGLIMGIANDHSIAWGIAYQLANAGAELALTYQGETFRKRVQPLAEKLGCKLLLECDVEKIENVNRIFEYLEKEWKTIDFVVHAIGFSDKTELKGRYVDVTTRKNFNRTMVISAYSFTEVAQRAGKLMPNGGALLTLTYGASQRVVPNYNIMGIAKAALEAMVRYLATDFGPQNIRVNAISAGPIRTLAGNGIASARAIFSYQRRNAPLRRTVNINEIGNAALYLLSDLSSGVTGEIHYVDSGYNILSMPTLEELKQSEEAQENKNSYNKK
ncbi:Enoyl-[acyl-carrier-protein] reductase [Bartonella clarridgeiae 73]|uniref:Enoyl-[acyl-carrier-protein] reductase [NADH] n=1 Tax=Bartonella clarridgeiae (strain CCUG 45776 / CIP 104772 / 73) TaxID=696125 RepID=E6YG32_BARC7|nr:enoyl-ACP reductase FabI [Bartonella clarridgeiae]WCR55573.1 MAG: Enoyl-[acyl-carrier-protein] reductase [NADH] [Bartonella clarridgeiae]CBI75820.1 Enoyl-[acyl-carrier-protein] reductase [Bartonella clarridgeiae 73]